MKDRMNDNYPYQLTILFSFDLAVHRGHVEKPIGHEKAIIFIFLFVVAVSWTNVILERTLEWIRKDHQELGVDSGSWNRLLSASGGKSSRCSRVT